MFAALNSSGFSNCGQCPTSSISRRRPRGISSATLLAVLRYSGRSFSTGTTLTPNDTNVLLADAQFTLKAGNMLHPSGVRLPWNTTVKGAVNIGLETLLLITTRGELLYPSHGGRFELPSVYPANETIRDVVYHIDHNNFYYLMKSGKVYVSIDVGHACPKMVPMPELMVSISWSGRVTSITGAQYMIKLGDEFSVSQLDHIEENHEYRPVAHSINTISLTVEGHLTTRVPPRDLAPEYHIVSSQYVYIDGEAGYLVRGFKK